jgi:DNA-directed RNA polymerase subunit F
VVADMVGKRAKQEEILLFIIQNRAAFLANKRENLSAEEARALIETIDEIDPRSAFKELNLYIRKRLAR